MWAVFFKTKKSLAVNVLKPYDCLLTKALNKQLWLAWIMANLGQWVSLWPVNWHIADKIFGI